MLRPYAVMGLTFFAVAAVLYNASGAVAVIAFALFSALFALSMLLKNTREGRVFPMALASAALACLLITVNNEFFYYPQLKTAGSERQICAVLTGEPEVRYGNYYCDARVNSVDGEKAYMRVRLVFSEKPEAEPYDSVEGSFTFYALGSSGASVADRYKTENRFLGAYPASGGYSVLPREGKFKPPGAYVTAFRNSLRNEIMRLLPNDYGALCLALLIGDRSELSAGAYSSLTQSGVTHIICISGLHLTVWTNAFFYILRKLGLKEKFAALLTMPVVAFVALAAGMTFSVVRAGIMMLVYLLGTVLSRRRDSLNSLGIAVLAIGVVNPYAMGAVSLKLSVLSTLGIILWGEYCLPGLKRFFEEHKRASFLEKPARMLCVTAAAMLFCLPVTADVYGSVSFAAIPANLLVIWAGEACMMCSAAAVAVAEISSAIINLPALVAGSLAKYIIKITGFISGFDFLTLKISRQSYLLLMAVVFAFCALAALTAYSGKKTVPFAVFPVCLLIVFCSVFSAAVSNSETRVRVADTGNGTAVLISDGGKNVLFGCGGDSYNGAYAICDAIENAGGGLDAVVVPGSGEPYAAWLYSVCREYGAGSYYLGESVSRLGLNAGEDGVFGDTESAEIGKIRFSPVSETDNSGYLIETDNITLLILFDPGVSPEDLNGKAGFAQALVTRMDVPYGAEFDNLVYAVIEADESRGAYVQSELSSRGINAVSTGNGSVLIRAHKGKCSIERF